MKNNYRNALRVARKLLKTKDIPIFDLDGVLLDATARQLSKPDGSICLEHYRKNSTPQQIEKDKALPFLYAVSILNAAKRPYAVLTARIVCEATLELLEKNEIRPYTIMGRAGELDTRRDDHLKRSHLVNHFPSSNYNRLVLIDDNQLNCDMVRNLGGTAYKIEFDGH